MAIYNYLKLSSQQVSDLTSLSQQQEAQFNNTLYPKLTIHGYSIVNGDCLNKGGLETYQATLVGSEVVRLDSDDDFPQPEI